MLTSSTTLSSTQVILPSQSPGTSVGSGGGSSSGSGSGSGSGGGISGGVDGTNGGVSDNGAGGALSSKAKVGTALGVVAVLLVALLAGAFMWRYWNRKRDRQREQQQRSQDSFLDQSGSTVQEICNGSQGSGMTRLSMNLDLAEAGTMAYSNSSSAGDYRGQTIQDDVYYQRPLSPLETRSRVGPNAAESSTTLPGTGRNPQERDSKVEMDFEPPSSPGRSPHTIPDDDVKVPVRRGLMFWGNKR